MGHGAKKRGNGKWEKIQAIHRKSRSRICRQAIGIGGIRQKNTLGDVKEELEPLAGSERGEPISNPSENLESNEDNGEPGINILNLIIIFMVVVIGLASVPSLRMIGVVVGVIAGVYFGATWVWKAIIKQEVRLFSVESGFYWLILCIGGAFVVFLVSYSGTP